MNYKFAITDRQHMPAWLACSVYFFLTYNRKEFLSEVSQCEVNATFCLMSYITQIVVVGLFRYILIRK